jgi:hypothetical protein
VEYNVIGRVLGHTSILNIGGDSKPHMLRMRSESNNAHSIARCFYSHFVDILRKNPPNSHERR